MGKLIGRPFEKGNPGKPKGAISDRVQRWKQLGEFITNEGAERAIEVMMSSPDKEFMEYYIKLIEYFSPKQARVSNEHLSDGGVTIVIPPMV